MKKPMIVLSLGLCLVFTLGLLTAFNYRNETKIKKTKIPQDKVIPLTNSSGKAAEA